MRRSSSIRCLSKVIGGTSVTDENITRPHSHCLRPLAEQTAAEAESQFEDEHFSDCRLRLSSIQINAPAPNCTNPFVETNAVMDALVLVRVATHRVNAILHRQLEPTCPPISAG